MKVKEPVRISGSHLFPTLILNRLVNLPEILNTPKSVQKHLDYDPRIQHAKMTPKDCKLIAPPGGATFNVKHSHDLCAPPGAAHFLYLTGLLTSDFNRFMRLQTFY